jgi:thiamine pyrophosphate-dependent acetolactate synthase large subunit-like protein
VVELFARNPGPADSAAIAEAARLINSAENPVVLLGLLASKPSNALVLRDFIGRNHLPVVALFWAGLRRRSTQRGRRSKSTATG